MKKKFWLYLFMALLILLAFNLASAQDDEPIEDLQEEYYEEEDNSSPDLIRTIKDYGNLFTFLDFMEKSGLIEELKGEGPITVLIPDDTAFAQLSSEQLKKLRTDKDYLKKTMSRHIVTGRNVTFDDDPEELTVKTFGGDVINIEVTEESVKIDKAWIIDEEIICSNGIIHVIDAVLLPPQGQKKG